MAEEKKLAELAHQDDDVEVKVWSAPTQEPPEELLAREEFFRQRFLEYVRESKIIIKYEGACPLEPASPIRPTVQYFSYDDWETEVQEEARRNSETVDEPDTDLELPPLDPWKQETAKTPQEIEESDIYSDLPPLVPVPWETKMNEVCADIMTQAANAKNEST